MARSITSYRRRDHVRIPDLLNRADLPSLNAITVRAAAMESWKAHRSNDGPNGTLNPVGYLLFPDNGDNDSTRKTRAVTSGSISYPLRTAADTFVWHATTVWNSSEALREASSKGAAIRVAKDLAGRAPI